MQHSQETEFHPEFVTDRIDRRLANLRIGNNTMGGNALDENDSSDDPSFYTYRASSVVRHMHRAPRGVGNTNRMASFLDTQGGDLSSMLSMTGNNAYVDGLELFVGFFVVTPFVLWFLVLAAFKLNDTLRQRHRQWWNAMLHHIQFWNTSDRSADEKSRDESQDEMDKSTPRTSGTTSTTTTPTKSSTGSDITSKSLKTTNAVTATATAKATAEATTTTTATNNRADVPTISSWIAGGSVIDLIALSKAGVRRKERKQLVLQSWKIQSVFLSVSILIPIVSVVMMKFGLKPLELALREVQVLNGDVETLAYRGWNALERLESSKHELFAGNELVRSIVEYSDSHENPQFFDDDDDDDDDDDNDRANRIPLRWLVQQRYLLNQERTTNRIETTMMQSGSPWWSQMATSSPTDVESSGPKIVDDNNIKVTGNQKGTSTTTSSLPAVPTAETLWWNQNTDKTLPPQESQNNDDGTFHGNGAYQSTLAGKKKEEMENKINNNNESPNNTSNKNQLYDSKRIEDPVETNVSPTVAPSTPVPISAPKSGIFIDEWCPDAPKYIGADELQFWASSINSLSENTKTISRIFNFLETSFPIVTGSTVSASVLPSHESIPADPEATKTITHGSSAFLMVTDVTDSVDQAIEWIFANDWLLKLLVLVLNVVNGLLLANVYFLSKNNVIHPPTRFYVAYVLVPMFATSAVLMVAVAISSGAAVLVNSDFCSGGNSGYGSPLGTLEDFILTLQRQNLASGSGSDSGSDIRTNDSVPSHDTLDLIYDAVDYYWTGCLTENPLQFLEDFSTDVDSASAKLNQISILLPNAASGTVSQSETIIGSKHMYDQTGQKATSSPGFPLETAFLDQLNKVCQRDMSFLPPAISDLENHVDQIKTHIHKLSDTMSCGEISPLLRRVSHGAMCVESPFGLAVIWGCAFGIGILCFVLLTVRAALYNSVKYKKQRPTKPRRVVEKEFQEYKQYMEKYYGEETTKEWKIDGVPLPPTKLEFEFEIEAKETFDTASPSSGSFGNSDQDEGSEVGGIHSPINGDDEDDDDDDSYGSSYDSEISDDEKSIDSSEEHVSVIGSILSDTRSIAFQTMHSLRNVTSLLSSAVKKPSRFQQQNQQQQNLSDLDTTPYNIQFREHRPSSPAVVSLSDGEKCENRIIRLNVHAARVDNEEDSIAEDSLYLPSPARSTKVGSKLNKVTPSRNVSLRQKTRLYESRKLLPPANSFSDDDEEHADPEKPKQQATTNNTASALMRASSRLKQALTPTNVISPMSPAAPRKTFPFLARTSHYRHDHTSNNCDDEEFTALVQPKKLVNLTSFRSKGKDLSSRGPAPNQFTTTTTTKKHSRVDKTKRFRSLGRMQP